MQNTLLFLAFIAIAFACKRDTQKTTTADIWLTTGDSLTRLEKTASLLFQQKKQDTTNLIRIDTKQTFQTILGFGASMTGSAAHVLTRYLNDTQRQEVMNALFSKEQGIGLSYMRMTIGASDFSSHNYSYNDPPNKIFDEQLEFFTIKEDQDDVIPRIKEAFAINADLELMGSPWSAPAFMKTNGNMVTGSLKTEAQAAFANYFVKYIQAFEQEGIKVSAITIQNEPEYEPAGYPGMLMTAEAQRDFIKNHLGPTFAKNQISTKIVVYDHNWDHPEYPLTILNDPEAKQFVDGSAFHCYAGAVSNQAKVQNAHPDKKLYFTECSGGGWSGSWRDNLMWNFKNLIIGNLQNWSTCVLLWNLALDENGGPTNGGCPNCRGVVTVSSKGIITKNIEYYTLGHVSQFVHKGAKRIASTDLSNKRLHNVAFQNLDGSIAMVILNENDNIQPVTIQSEQGLLHYAIPAYSVVTIHWQASL